MFNRGTGQIIEGKTRSMASPTTSHPAAPLPGSAHNAHSLRQKLRLTFSLSQREILGRYRGSALGLFWSIATPLMMLGVYTFVFGTVFKSRWSGLGSEASAGQFSVILFSGLIIFQLLSETITRAPTLILANANYVKKVIFPLEVLVPVSIGTSLFHSLISLLMLLPFIYLTFGSIPITALLLPVTLVPVLLMLAGIGWFLASIGVFVRDIGQFIGTIVTALLFLAPIFFPLTALPDWLQPWLSLNPLTVPVEQTREVLIFGRLPDFEALGIYTAIAFVILLAGYGWFQKTRKGFADVL